MIDLDKLNSQFDLKDLDAAKLTKLLGEHQNSLIKFALIVGTLFMAGVLFNDHRVKEQDLHTKISQLQGKLQTAKARDKAVQDLNTFKSSIPKKLNEFEIITLISDYAKSNNVNISSLSPAESRDMGLYDLIDVSFNAESDNFKDMMFFLRKIESSVSSIRINSWEGHELEGGRIDFNLEISAVVIHT